MQRKRWHPQQFAATLQRVLDHLDLRQTDIATWAGVSQSQASRWVAGRSRPGHDTLQRLQHALLAHAPNDGHLRDLVRTLGAAAGYPALSADVETIEIDPRERRIRALGLPPDVEARLLEIRRQQDVQLDQMIELARRQK